MLASALDELERAYAAAQADPAFQRQFHALLRDYVGRPSALYAAERLRAVGFGQGRPTATNTSAGGRAANRRVAFTVLRTRSRVIEASRPPDS